MTPIYHFRSRRAPVQDALALITKITVTSPLTYSPITKGVKRVANFSPVLLNQKRLRIFSDLTRCLDGEVFESEGVELTVVEKSVCKNLLNEFRDIEISVKGDNNSFTDSGKNFILEDMNLFLECKIFFNKKIDDGTFQAKVFNTTLSPDIPIFECGQIIHYNEVSEFEPIMAHVGRINNRDGFLFQQNEYGP